MNTKPPRERESKVQKSIRIRLWHRFGIRLWRRNVAAFAIEDGIHKRRWVRAGEAGQSDLWGIDYPQQMTAREWFWGRHWEIETKAKGKRPTEKQLKWLKDMTKRGCVCFWADNANTAERISEAIIAGGRIVWREGPGYHPDGADFDVEMTP